MHQHLGVAQPLGKRIDLLDVIASVGRGLVVLGAALDPLDRAAADGLAGEEHERVVRVAEDLRPERALAADLGLFAEGTTSALELTGYIHFVRDQITWVPQTGRVWSPENTSRVRTWGAEATYRHRWRFLQTDLALAYTDARDRSDPAAASFGHRLRYVPPRQLKLHLGFGLGPLRLDPGAGVPVEDRLFGKASGLRLVFLGHGEILPGR